VLATGQRPKGLFLSVTASPARVIPKGGDPLKVCDGSRTAALVGRNNGVSYVLLVPGTKSDPPPEVVPLGDDDDAVATGTAERRSCVAPVAPP
jgi:hypothetical protein